MGATPSSPQTQKRRQASAPTVVTTAQRNPETQRCAAPGATLVQSSWLLQADEQNDGPPPTWMQAFPSHDRSGLAMVAAFGSPGGAPVSQELPMRGGGPGSQHPN